MIARLTAKIFIVSPPSVHFNFFFFPILSFSTNDFLLYLH